MVLEKQKLEVSMKKVFSIVLVLMIFLSLVACGNNLQQVESDIQGS